MHEWLTGAHLDVADTPSGNYVDALDPAAYLVAGKAINVPRWQQKGQSAILRAAVASFGFMFIHPMSDGNGRISRFLVNDVLRRDNAVPAPFILPISATITNSASERVAYDRAVDHFSRPLMRAYGDRYRFGALVRYPDAVESNFAFDAYDEALPVWRYPDLT